MFEKEIERAAAKAAEQARQRQREQAVAASTVSQSHRLSLRATLLQTDPGPTEAAGAALLPTHVLTFLSGMVVSVTRSRSLYRCWVGADGAGGVCVPAVRTDQMHAQRESAGRRLYAVCTADRALLRHVLRSILCSFTFVNFSSYFPMLFDPGVALWLCGSVIVSKSVHYTHKCYMSNWAGTHKSHTGSQGQWPTYVDIFHRGRPISDMNDMSARARWL